MTRTSSKIAGAGAVLGLLALTAPHGIEGQRRGPQQPASAAWPSITIGAKGGWDNNANAEVLGGQLRLPLLRNGSLELMPTADVTFATGLKEYQYAVEALFLQGDRRGGLYLGGGLAFRNTIYGADASLPRETRQGYSVVVGSKFGIASGGLGVQLELRWVFIRDTPIDPQVVSFGINFPLTGRRSRGRGPGS